MTTTDSRSLSLHGSTAGEDSQRGAPVAAAGQQGKAATRPESEVEALLRISRSVHPDVYRRADAVARIIDPGAFAEGWVIQPDENAELFRSKRAYQQSAALSKAMEVLRYLGVNTETDWYEVLSRFAEERNVDIAVYR